MSTQRRPLLLLDPNTDGGGAATLETPPAPAAAPAAAPSAKAAPAAAPAGDAPPADEPESDDPFQLPKPKPAAGAPAGKPAAAAPSKPAAASPELDFEKAAPKELREYAKRIKAENQTFSGQIKTLESKIAELDKKGVDTSALTTRLTAIEKERDSAQAELRAARQEASPEFKEKWDKPFNMAAGRAQKQIEELAVIVDSESGETRPAKWDDFKELYSLPTGKALDRAKALFGDASSFVMQVREKLLDMDDARTAALAEEREQYKERNAKETAEQAVRRQKVGTLWNETNKRLSETVGDYKVDPTDTEAVEARKHALAVFDAEVDQSDPEQFIQKKVTKDAHIRQQVAGYRVRGILLKRKDEQIAKLQAQIAELKGVAPGDTQRPGGDGGDGTAEPQEWGDALVKAVNQ